MTYQTAKERIEQERLANEAAALAAYNTSLAIQDDNKTFLIVDNFSSITAQTKKKIICVSSDETNNNEPTLYFFDGTNLNWIPTVRV